MAKSYLDKDGLLYFLQKIRPSATPSMDGSASTGTSKRFAAEDHVHPSDTSRAPLASPALTGTPTAPTAATGTSTTQIATTEFVANSVGAMTSGVSDVKIDNVSIVTSGIAAIPTASSSGKGLMTSTHYSKLEGIASGAEVNQNAFSYVKVGSSTITALAKMSEIELVAGNNISLDVTDGKVRINSIVDSLLEVDDESATAISLSTHDGTGYWSVLLADSKGIANGVCPLNASSTIDSTYLPSYVDDVIEAYARTGQTALSQNWLSTTSGGSALTPETGKIYVLMADSGDYAANTQFRWGGSAYVKLADGGVSAITNAEIDTIVAA